MSHTKRQRTESSEDLTFTTKRDVTVELWKRKEAAASEMVGENDRPPTR
jgi:hypothetical protein